MSDQHPIHRDRDKRSKGAQPFKDDKEAFNQKQAKLDRNAPLPADQGDDLTDEQREELRKQAASEQLAEVQREVDDNESTQG